MSKQKYQYSIMTLPLIMQDSQRRSYYFKKAFSLLDRKAEMDICYASTLETLIAKQYQKGVNESIPTQYLYARIVQYCLEEAQRMRKVGERLRDQATGMQGHYERDSPQLKKNLILAQSIIKDITAQRQKIEKSRAKMQKKSKQLQASKIEYLCSYLSNEQLQRKNQLYLEVNNFEQIVRPLRQQYLGQSRRFNDQVEVSVQQIHSILTRVESVELRRMTLMKNAVRSYLEIQKDCIDQTLRHNPFRRATVDSLNEHRDFQPHSDNTIHLQKQTLLFPEVAETGFVDHIYNRIEAKKDLQQLILYGQQREHRLRLRFSSIDFLKQEGHELGQKTYRMMEIFKQVFEGTASQQLLRQLRILLRGQQSLRKDFILCLQKFRIRSQFELRLQSKECILGCLNVFLDVCEREYDTYNSKMLMVLSLTYFFVEEGRKIELQELISPHSIWKRLGWWQSALLQSIFQETRVKVKKEEAPITIWDIKAGGVSRREEGEELTHQHICFNQLLYYVSNMSLFHLPSHQIIHYAKQNIAFLKLTGNFARDILALCPQVNSELL